MPSHNLCHPRRPTWRSWLLGCWLRPNVCACSAMPSSTGEHAARGGVTEREGVCTWRNSKGSLLFCRSEFMAMFSSCYLISLPQFRLHQLSKELPRKSPTYYSRSGVSGRAAHTRTMLHRRSAHWIKIQSHMYIYDIPKPRINTSKTHIQVSTPNLHPVTPPLTPASRAHCTDVCRLSHPMRWSTRMETNGYNAVRDWMWYDACQSVASVVAGNRLHLCYEWPHGCALLRFERVFSTEQVLPGRLLWNPLRRPLLSVCMRGKLGD